MILTVVLSVWLLCSIPAYLGLRYAIRKDFGGWTVGDRLFVGSMSLIGGPAALIAASVFFLVASAGDLNSPASW